jgi:hypothetical protein
MTATEGILERLGSVSSVPPGVWLSLGVLILALTLGFLWIFRAARQTLRDLRSVRAAVDGTVSGVAAAAERLATTGAAVAADSPRLEAATTRLRRSLARQAVLGAAVHDLEKSISGIAALYPRK